MRTTFDLDDEILLATKELARQQGVSLGKVISHLARVALTRQVAEAMAHPIHALWLDSLSLLDRSRVHWASLTGHRQVTDVYLLALAVSQGGRFVTFDPRMTLSTVVDARQEHLLILGAGR